MPRSISKFVMVAVAIGVAVVGASAIGIAAAQSSHELAPLSVIVRQQFARFIVRLDLPHQI
jgi:hypothetical protein